MTYKATIDFKKDVSEKMNEICQILIDNKIKTNEVHITYNNESGFSLLFDNNSNISDEMANKFAEMDVKTNTKYKKNEKTK